MDKIITFGVAVYNVETYIRSCIESVCAQTGDFIEIILVDDGSTDRSGEICEEYAKKDSRIRVIHQRNQGVSVARNTIISQAQGTWISFIDGDDKLTEDAASRILEHSGSGCDIVFFDAVFFRFDGSEPTYVIDEPPLLIDDKNRNDLILRTFYPTADAPKYINKTMGVIWGKIYKTQFLREHGILFNPALCKSQDIIFSLECLRFLEQALVVRKPIYFYRMNPNSIMNRYSEKMISYNLLLVDAFREMAAFHEETVGNEIWQRYYMVCILLMRGNLMLNICHSGNPLPYSERLRTYRQLETMEWFQEAVAKVDAQRLSKSDRELYRLIREDDFKRICKSIRKAERVGKAKALLSKIGLNKLINPLRQKLQR